jgi:hypothetical protein
MGPSRMTMMTEDDIRTELGWNDSMIYSLLQNPDSPANGRRKKLTGGYIYGLTSANVCWPSLNRRRASIPNGGGMRRYALTGRTQAGRHDSAI